MKKFIIIYLSAIILLVTACTDEASFVEITYTKATAIYKSQVDFSKSIVSSSPRNIVDPGKIFFSETLLLIGEEGQGVHVFDNSDPLNPIPISFIEIPDNHHFYVHGDILYAADIMDLLKIDISDILNPRIVGQAKYSFSENMVNENGDPLVGFEYEEVTEILNEGDNVYELLYNQDDRVLYYDYNNIIIPTSNVPSSFAGGSGQTLGTMNRIAFYKDYLYVLTNKSILTFEDKEEFSLQHYEYSSSDLETIYPLNDRLYVGTASSMLIYSIENPNRPKYKGAFIHATSCDPVLPMDDVVYVTLRTGDVTSCPGNNNALVVLDMPNRALQPRSVNQINMQSPYGMTMIGEQLYVGEGHNGLRVFDATDRINPSSLHFFKDIKAFDVLPHPTKANVLLIASDEGLIQYQINDSSNLEILSQIEY